MLKHLKTFTSFLRLNESIRIEKIDPITYENETVTALPYINYIKDNRQEFLKKLIKISKDLGIKPLWLMHTIFHESRFDTRKFNRITKESGLLSFFPKVLNNFLDQETGKNLKPKDILEMSNNQQLDIIYSFYNTWIEDMNIKNPIRPGDFAAITFYPALIKKSMDWEFPLFVVEKNHEFFKKFKSGKKTKKDYYEYMEKVLNNEDEYSDSEDYLLGEFSGALVDPVTYSNKKSLEFYQDFIIGIEDPLLNQGVQDKDNKEDKEDTEKFKQKQ